MLIDKFDYVMAVAEEQNITRAASRVFLSQPALTNFLNNLESDLNVKLFDRTKTPVQITKAGEYYIAEMKKIAMHEKTIRSTLRHISNADKTLTIGTGHARGQIWLPIILPIFCAEFPQMNINIVQDTDMELADKLLHNQLDLAINTLPPIFDSLEIVNLGNEKMLLMAHQKYNLVPPEIRHEYGIERPYKIKAETLQSLPFITTAMNSSLNNVYLDLLQENNLQPSRIITANNPMTAALLAAEGLGILLHYPAITRSFQNKDEIDFMYLEKMPLPRDGVVAYRKDNQKIEYIKEIISLIHDEILQETST